MNKLIAKLPITPLSRPIRSPMWMSPLSFVGYALFALPLVAIFVCTNFLNVAVPDKTAVIFMVICVAFGGLYVIAYDQKLATHRAQKAGLKRNQKTIGKWTYL